MFTAFGQQMLGGYPVPEDIARKAREAASSPNPQKGIDAICNEIEEAQLAQVEQAIHDYLTKNPQQANLEVVLHAVEIGDNKGFYASITPHEQLPDAWISQDLARHRIADCKQSLRELKKKDEDTSTPTPSSP